MTPTPSEMPGHRAAIEYAQQHRDTLRRIISSRLGARLRQVYGTTDIEQSLMRALLEQAPPPHPLSDAELSRLVIVIALRSIRNKARDEHHSRWDPAVGKQELVSNPDDDPAALAAARDFFEAARAVAEEDWPLLEQRLQGRTFKELVATFGSTADGLRMRFNRAIDRIAGQLGGSNDE